MESLHKINYLHFVRSQIIRGWGWIILYHLVLQPLFPTLLLPTHWTERSWAVPTNRWKSLKESYWIFDLVSLCFHIICFWLLWISIKCLIWSDGLDIWCYSKTTPLFSPITFTLTFTIIISEIIIISNI